MESTPARRLTTVTLVAYLLLLLYALLTPSAATLSSSVSWVAEALRDLGAPERVLVPDRVEFLCNVAILVPATALGSLLWPSANWRDWTAYGFVFAGTIEVLQGLLLPERSATYVDVVANTLGALTGGVLVSVVRLAYARRPKWRT